MIRTPTTVPMVKVTRAIRTGFNSPFLKARQDIHQPTSINTDEIPPMTEITMRLNKYAKNRANCSP